MGLFKTEKDFKKATWVNGKKTITGSYEYLWGANTFVVRLNSTDRITGLRRSFTIKGDKPEWGNWKLVDASTKKEESPNARTKPQGI